MQAMHVTYISSAKHIRIYLLKFLEKYAKASETYLGRFLEDVNSPIHQEYFQFFRPCYMIGFEIINK